MSTESTPTPWNQQSLAHAAREILENLPHHRALAVWLANQAVSTGSSGVPPSTLITELNELQNQYTTSDAFTHVSPSSLRLSILNPRVLFGVGALILSSLVISTITGTLQPRMWTRPRLEGITLLSSQQGFGKLGIGVDASGAPIMLEGKLHPEGLGTHATSKIELMIAEGKAHLQGVCGYPDAQTKGEVICRITQDGQELLRTHPLNAKDRSQTFRIRVSPDRPVTLAVQSTRPEIHYAHAVWCNLKVDQ